LPKWRLCAPVEDCWEKAFPCRKICKRYKLDKCRLRCNKTGD
jgi:hypothetical protein